MKRKLALLLVAAAFMLPCVAAAATVQDFQVHSAGDLLDLCTTTADSPLYKEAIHFCHGFLVGAYRYHVAVTSDPEGTRLVCFPDPPPSRNAAVAMFVEWLKAHPEFLGERPVEAEFRFLMEKWPCKR